jgi:hypothetical protein
MLSNTTNKVGIKFTITEYQKKRGLNFRCFYGFDGFDYVIVRAFVRYRFFSCFAKNNSKRSKDQNCLTFSPFISFPRRFSPQTRSISITPPLVSALFVLFSATLPSTHSASSLSLPVIPSSYIISSLGSFGNTHSIILSIFPIAVV